VNLLPSAATVLNAAGSGCDPRLFDPLRASLPPQTVFEGQAFVPTTKRLAGKTSSTTLSSRTKALKTFLETRPGAAAVPVAAPKAVMPLALMFKIMGKMFAVLSLRGDEYVVLKCDPHLAETLRSQYEGIGHRTHLDPRHWIAVKLDADVPKKEIERLAALSYALVAASLTRKQQAELVALRGN
jgi:predicted DNA-binding protein (MmcQ/YjbR family)